MFSDVEVESHSDDDDALWRGPEKRARQARRSSSGAKQQSSSFSRTRDACLHNLESVSVAMMCFRDHFRRAAESVAREELESGARCTYVYVSI